MHRGCRPATALELQRLVNGFQITQAIYVAAGFRFVGFTPSAVGPSVYEGVAA